MSRCTVTVTVDVRSGVAHCDVEQPPQPLAHPEAGVETCRHLRGTGTPRRAKASKSRRPTARV
ncbi:hypothetical protein U875_20380 [Pandoraea pnomenusa 3kgm]|nr:hypothetical protein U875_20380 [Pandoraea pnomenusa 3kgm]AHN77478.1 hypothetical protein DA70_13070 [Pandoraea pnomenusa]ANC45267.1 hypothetical protein A6P55_14840 [Pandoraea pnomenusa]